MLTTDVVRFGENFLYVFKGARSAPRAWRRRTAHAIRRGKLAQTAESGRDAPAGGTRRTSRRPLALPRQRTAAAAEARPVATRRTGWTRNPPRMLEQGPFSRRGPLSKPNKITVEAVCDRRSTPNGQASQVHVHAKTALTVIFYGFNQAPVGRTARTGLARFQVLQEMLRPASHRNS